MQSSEFNQLSEFEQLLTLEKAGAYVGYQVKGAYLVKLYQLHHFYVELYWHIERNRMDAVKCFSSTELLAPYLKKMKVDLKNCFIN